MPTDDWDRHRPYPTPSDSTWVPSPSPAKPDRATYQALRRAELNRIRLIDIKRRQLLVYFCPLGIHEIDHLWDDEDISLDDRRSTIRWSLRSVSATESWSTQSKDICWGA